MSKLLSNDYSTLLGDVKQRIRSAQYEALKAVNKELISLYWDIGSMIVERQKGETWGRSVVQKLAGRTTSSLWKNAKMIFSVNSIFA